MARCPNIESHTDCPKGYLNWHDWAEKKGKTHVQILCWGCGLWVIWEDKNKKEEILDV